MSNFTILDATGALRAIAAFAAILFAPGYLTGFAIDLFGFRTRTLLERIAWSIALSFAVSPILITFAGRLIPLSALALIFAAAGVGALALLAAGWRELKLPVNGYTVVLAIFLVGGSVLVVGELVDIQHGDGLSLSVTVLDQAYRVAFTNAVLHSGIPPLNPLYHPGEASPLRYYYFWYAVCAVCSKLAHASARQALIASSVWTGFGLTALIALYLRHFFGVRERLLRLIAIATLLLTVTGLDLLPVLYNLIAHHDFNGDLEWWSADQVASWLDTILWVPNHLASMLCCLVAFLLLWRTRRPLGAKQQVAAILVAGAAAAGAFGLSVYVAAHFGMLMLGWGLILLVRRRDFAGAQKLSAAVAAAGALSIPYLRELLAARSGSHSGASAGSASLFKFGLRGMIDPELVTLLPLFSSLHRAHPVLLDQTVRLILLLPGYALEFGAFGLALVLACKDRARLDDARRTALGLALGGVFIMSVLRSAVIGNNDFGYRAALLPCFFMLLFAAERLGGTPARHSNGWMTLLVLVGLAGTAFQALMLREYVPLHSQAGMPGFATLPQQVFAARTAFAAANAAIPPGAIVQANLTEPGTYVFEANMMYSQRGMATDAGDDCGSVFGGDPERCDDVQEIVQKIFASPAPSAAEARDLCRQAGIDDLAVARSDPAWQDAGGWVWTLPLVTSPAEGSSFRIVHCGDVSPRLP